MHGGTGEEGGRTEARGRVAGGLDEVAAGVLLDEGIVQLLRPRVPQREAGQGGELLLERSLKLGGLHSLHPGHRRRDVHTCSGPSSPAADKALSPGVGSSPDQDGASERHVGCTMRP